MAIDDATRLAYTEVLKSETREDCIAFLMRSLAFFARHGVAVQQVMTDNGSAYRSFAFPDVLRDAALEHIRTRPYTPRTNGKAERLIQTSLRVGLRRPLPIIRTANPRLAAQRTRALQPFLTNYNTARPHSALADQTPWLRLNNLLGNDS